MSINQRAKSIRELVTSKVLGRTGFRWEDLDKEIETHLREQDKLTRHACAEAVFTVPVSDETGGCPEADAVHQSVMNCNGGTK